MNAADPEKSKRLQKVRKVLADGRWHSTLAIVRKARVLAVSAIVAELRQAGHDIECVSRAIAGRRVWLYRCTR